MLQTGIMFFIMTVVLGKSSSVLGKAATNNSLSRHLGFGGHSPRGQNRGRESWREKKKKERKRYTEIQRESFQEELPHTMWNSGEKLSLLNIDYNKTWLAIESKYRPEQNTFVTVWPVTQKPVAAGAPTYRPTRVAVYSCEQYPTVWQTWNY